MCELLKIPYMPELNPKANLAELYDSIDVSLLNGTYAALYENFSLFLERNCGMKPAEETNAVISHRGGILIILRIILFAYLQYFIILSRIYY